MFFPFESLSLRVFVAVFQEGLASVAKTSLIVKQKRRQKFRVRHYNRCFRCGRPRGYMREFGICRICFRELALQGDIPGITKASW